MKKFWFQLIGLVLVIFAGTFLTFNREYMNSLLNIIKPGTSTPGTGQTAPNALDKLSIIGPDGTVKARLEIEISDDKAERSKGLGYRESLATNSGMLFIHDDAQKYTYWMKGMEFPIDIMWIKDDTIMDIIPNIPPPIEGQTDDTLERYSSTVEVDKVLETNAGFVTEKNIQIGDKIKLEPVN